MYTLIELRKIPLLGLIDMQVGGDRKESMLKLHESYDEVLAFAAGSSHNHQAWEGGYRDHIAECLRFNILYRQALGDVGFQLEEAAMALLFHDAEKLYKYGPEGHSLITLWRHRHTLGEVDAETLKWRFITGLEESFGFELTEAELHAIHYAHGEGDEYRKDKRVMSPLAAHVGNCDRTSARIFPDGGRGLG